MHIIDEKFWLAIAFFAFAVLIIKYVWPILSGAIAAQSDQIAKDLNDAKEAKEKAEALLKKTQEQYDNAVETSKKILSDAKDEARKFIEDSKASVEDEISRKVEALNNRIKSEQEKAIRDIKGKIIDATLKSARESLEGAEKENFENVVKKSIGDISKLVH